MHKFSILLLLLALVQPALAADEALGIGDSVPQMALPDQFGVQHRLGQEPGQGPERVLFAADRPGSRLAQQALAGWDSDRMRAARLDYVADISGMPAPITRLFALPALKKLPYPVLLIQDADGGAMLPHRGNQATLITVADGHITAIDYFEAAAPLRDALGD